MAYLPVYLMMYQSVPSNPVLYPPSITATINSLWASFETNDQIQYGNLNVHCSRHRGNLDHGIIRGCWCDILDDSEQNIGTFISVVLKAAPHNVAWAKSRWEMIQWRYWYPTFQDPCPVHRSLASSFDNKFQALDGILYSLGNFAFSWIVFSVVGMPSSLSDEVQNQHHCLQKYGCRITFWRESQKP